jgi:putative ABC transport system permease protein
MRVGRGHNAVRGLYAVGRAYAGPLVAIALITLVVCGGLVGGQREVDTRTTGAFQTYFQQHASTSAVTVNSTVVQGSSADLAQAAADVRKLLPAPAGAYRGSGWTFEIPEAISDLPTWLPSERPETSRVQHQLPSGFSLVTDSQLIGGSGLRYTSGTAPSCGSTCTGADAAHPLPIAVSAATASSLRLKVGDAFTLDSTSGTIAHVAISGLFQAAGTATADAAGELGSLLNPSPHYFVDTKAAIGSVPWLQWNAWALVPADGMLAATTWTSATATWNYQVVASGLSADQAQAFGQRMRALVSAANLLPTAGDSRPGRTALGQAFSPAVVLTGVPDTIAAFEADASAARALGLFVLIGAAVVGVATIQLALRVLFARQQTDLALRRARGLGTAAAARRAAAQAAACTLPAAALGIAGALLLVPGGEDAFVIGVGAAVVLGLPLAAALTALGPARMQPASPRRRRALRRTGAGLVLLLLAGAITAVRTQLSDAANADLVSASLPTLAATAGALIVGTLVALLARPASWLAAGRTRAAALFLAAAHAARRPALPAAAAVALLVATSSAVFASSFTASLDAARQQTAWQQTGADLRMHAQGDGSSIDPDAEAHVAAAPGVRAGATGAVLPAEQLSTKQGVLNLTVIVVDPAEYAKLIARTALDSSALHGALQALERKPAAAETVSAIISSNLSGLMQGGGVSVGVQQINTQIAPVAQLDSFPATGTLGTFIVLPRDQVEAVTRLTPPITDAWFDLAPGRNQALVRAQAVPGVAVTDRAQRAAGLNEGPVGAIARWTSRAAVVFDLALAVVCLLLAGTLTAPARAAGRTFLATLGASRSTGVAASVLESLPAFAMISVVATAAAFGALALLAPLIGRMAVGDPNALPLSALSAPAPALLAVLGIPALGLLLAAGRAAAEHRTRLSFLRDERAS